MDEFTPQELKSIAVLMEFIKKQEAKASAQMSTTTANPKPKRVNRALAPPPSEATHDTWYDVYGTKYWVHRWKLECRDGCAIHAPSYHHMRTWPQVMRSSTLIERTCPHGVGHPDPDSLKYFKANGQSHMAVHGCDGCCVERRGEDCMGYDCGSYHCLSCNPYGYDAEDIH